MIARRSFLKSIAGIIASAALAQKIVLDAFATDCVTVEKPLPESKQLNPEWENAPYETCIIYHPDVMTVLADLPLTLAEETKRAVQRVKAERWTFAGGEFKKVPKHLP